ncbi:MAG: N-acetyltransferase family protein [Hyphomonadaceae bacterium]
MNFPAFTIIDADESHLQGITAIYNQAVRETFSIWSETEITVEQRRRWLHARRNASFPVIVAVRRIPGRPDDVIGYGSYGVFRDFPGYANTVEHSVYVRPDAHGQGVGRALLLDLIERARTQNVTTMVGGVDSQNAASIALHRALGFEKQGELKGVGQKFGRSLDLIFMVKGLHLT